MVCFGYCSLIYHELIYYQCFDSFNQNQFCPWNRQQGSAERLMVLRDHRVTSAETLMGSHFYHHLITLLLWKHGQKTAFKVPAKSLLSASTGMPTGVPVQLPMTTACGTDTPLPVLPLCLILYNYFPAITVRVSFLLQGFFFLALYWASVVLMMMQTSGNKLYPSGPSG